MGFPPVEGEEAFDDPRTDPVDDLRCLWCKIHMQDAEPDLRFREVDNDEVLCENCLEDARHFKRGEDVFLVLSTVFDDEVPGLKEKLSEAMWNAAEEVLQEHDSEIDTEFYYSNATGREEQDPSVERKADLTPADMDPDDEDDEGPGPVEWVQGHPDGIANVGEFLEEFDEETLIDLTPDPLQYSATEDLVYLSEDE